MQIFLKPVLLAICLSFALHSTTYAVHVNGHGGTRGPGVPEGEINEEDDGTSFVPRRLVVSSLYAGGITWSEIINNLLFVIAMTIFYVAAAAFLIGALMYTAGFINEEYKSKGKQLMIGSLTGMALVLAARAIFNAAYFFVYGI